MWHVLYWITLVLLGGAALACFIMALVSGLTPSWLRKSMEEKRNQKLREENHRDLRRNRYRAAGWFVAGVILIFITLVCALVHPGATS